MTDMIDSSDRLITEIKKRAALFCADNFTTPTLSDLLLTESVMLIGASIANEVATADLQEETENVLKSCRVEPAQDFYGSGGDDCEVIRRRQQQAGGGTL